MAVLAALVILASAVLLSSSTNATNSSASPIGPNTPGTPGIDEIEKKVLIRGPTGNYTAILAGDKIRLKNGTSQTVGNISQLSWLFNGSYAAFGVHYVGQDCKVGQWPDRPQFYIQCPVGSSFKIVAIKDPKVNVACRDYRGKLLTPATRNNMVEVYEVDTLGVECSATLSASVMSSNIFLSILVGTSFAATAFVFITMFIFLKRAKNLQTEA